jgi:hypothetical protein
MSERTTLARYLHDLGLSVWFGGTLAGAVGFNGAAADVPDEKLRLRVANAAWNRWTPVNFVAIASHVVGGALLLAEDRRKLVAQQGLGSVTSAKLALTGAALAATAYSRVLGKKLNNAEGEPVAGGTDPAPTTDPTVASVQRQLKVTQWVIPALTGAVAVLGSLASEKQRAGAQVSGIAGRSASLAETPAKLVDALT